MDSNQYAAAVAANIDAARVAAGMSKLALAEAAGIPRTSFDRRFSDPAAYPFTVREVRAVALALGTTALALTTVYDMQAAVA